jgi:hypothetical protein
MPFTDTQKLRAYVEVAPLIPQLRQSARPERAKTLREALERAGAQPTWAEWDAYAEEALGDDATHVRSDTLRL